MKQHIILWTIAITLILIARHLAIVEMERWGNNVIITNPPYDNFRTTEEVDLAMKFHGTEHTWFSPERQQWLFKNTEGKTCLLFTDSANLYVERMLDEKK